MSGIFSQQIVTLIREVVVIDGLPDLPRSNSAFHNAFCDQLAEKFRLAGFTAYREVPIRYNTASGSTRGLIDIVVTDFHKICRIEFDNCRIKYKSFHKLLAPGCDIMIAISAKPIVRSRHRYTEVCATLRIIPPPLLLISISKFLK